MSILEDLSSTQHEIWSHWMKYLFSVCRPNDDGEMVIPEYYTDHWKRQLSTDYAELTEDEKESDRDQAIKVIGTIEAAFRTQ